MSSDMPTQIVQSLRQLTPDQQTEVMTQAKPILSEEAKQAVTGTMPSSSKDRTKIWMTLLIGLFAMGALSIAGTLALILNGKGSEATALVAVATAVVTGAVGLFAQSPTSGGN